MKLPVKVYFRRQKGIFPVGFALHNHEIDYGNARRIALQLGLGFFSFWITNEKEKKSGSRNC